MSTVSFYLRSIGEPADFGEVDRLTKDMKKGIVARLSFAYIIGKNE